VRVHALQVVLWKQAVSWVRLAGANGGAYLSDALGVGLDRELGQEGQDELLVEDLAVVLKGERAC